MEHFDLQKTYRILKNCFLKVKTFICYDKTLLHLKMKIAEFENDPQFDAYFQELASRLENQDLDYFNNLIDGIGFVAKPKKFSEPENEDYYAKLSISKKSKVTDVNFFIDCDIRLIVLDMLFMLFIRKIASSHFSFANSYAARFKKSVFLSHDESLISGIDFESNRCFVNYFDSYKKWRDSAFEKVNAYSLENNTHSILFSLDINSFYYNVEFSFDDLKTYLNFDCRLEQIGFLQKIIESVYKKYYKVIKNYYNFGKRKEGTFPFPIGLFSPLVLRDIYLNKLDESFSACKDVIYYGRYVDDILFLVSEQDEGKKTDEYIDKHLIQTNILVKGKSPRSEYYFSGYENLKTSFAKKDRYFFFEKGKESILINAFKEVLNRTTSEESLLPDLDFLDGDFDKKVYGLIFNDASHALRNLNLVISDISSATHYMKSMIRLYKGTSFDSRKNTINDYIKKINNFFDECLSIQYSQSWTLLFESLVILGDDYVDEANNLYSKIKTKVIDLSSYMNLDKGKYNQKHIKKLEKNVAKSLKSSLNISLCLAFCLNPAKCKFRGLKKEYIRLFRKSNMFDHSIATIKLIGYLNGVNDQMSLIEPDFSFYLKNINDFSFDLRKVELSPSFFHYNDLSIIGILQSIKQSKEVTQKELNELYVKFNHITTNAIYDLIEPKENNEQLVRTFALDDKVFLPNPLVVALPNVCYDENDVADTLFNRYSAFSFDKKVNIIRILLESHSKGANFVVFPELYFPLEWIIDIFAFARAYQISIMFGSLYLTYEKRAYNFVTTLLSFKIGSFKYTYPTIREKIHYPPHENQILASAGYCAKNANPRIDVFRGKDYSLSNLLCFELTDISLRSTLKENGVDVLVIPELNPDTNYFSSLIESSARDLYAYIIQENSAAYGDCRITGPYNTLRKNIVQFKGGKELFVVTHSINFLTFKKQKNELEKRLSEYLDECKSCRKVKGRMKKEKRKRMCDICRAERIFKIKKLYGSDPTGHIKPRPPKI